MAPQPARPRPSSLRASAAERLVRALDPLAQRAGGWVSSRLVVVADDGVACPDVALAAGEPPASGCVAHGPELVVALRAEEGEQLAAWWLAHGARAVWVLADGAVVAHSRAGRAIHPPGSFLALPVDAAEAVAVDALMAAAVGGQPARGTR